MSEIVLHEPLTLQLRPDTEAFGGVFAHYCRTCDNVLRFNLKSSETSPTSN